MGTVGVMTTGTDGVVSLKSSLPLNMNFCDTETHMHRVKVCDKISIKNERDAAAYSGIDKTQALNPQTRC